MISAVKSNLGHGVAAACAWESVMAMMSLHTQTIPRINGLNHPIDVPLNFAKENQRLSVSTIVKNSLVFGGINYSFVFRRYDKET